MDGNRSLRRSSRRSNSSAASGSNYQASEKSFHEDVPPADDEEDEIVVTKSSRGRTVKLRRTYIESDFEDEEDEPVPQTRTSKRRLRRYSDDDERERRNPNPRNDLDGFIERDEETRRYPTRNRQNKRQHPAPRNGHTATNLSSREQRALRRHPPDEDYVNGPSSPGSPDADGSFDEDPEEVDLAIDMDDGGAEGDADDQDNKKPYGLRARREGISYKIPTLDDIIREPPKSRAPRNHRKGKGGAQLPWSMSSRDLGRALGAVDDSDSDNPGRTPGKSYRARLGMPQPLQGDMAIGTPSHLGKVTDASLADADPLGVNVNVTFDNVGGLDDHINSLKEMTLLPLLYPEVFQQFNITPPRGVLFHGPPGTGKTLLARALAASCRSDGKKITFFMRKGADALSKWVGEAERQLRLLFDEARACQPSIIFFDEIDGLAPVRSSKQEQIHASIVSTLLALMDGMDGRGQVIIIGATNRPDSVDPALRRPGRFDREFYFPLPNLDARKKILEINMKGWEGWSKPEDDARLAGLAHLTKGYGGADLRALCTEAALNAVQRRYPQIYKSNDRLLLKPDTIHVGLRDFMIAIKKLVPSSARSTSSVAEPLPVQMIPLLTDPLEKVKAIVSRVLPMDKKRTALEEAEFEDYQGEEGALERELTMQSMERLRVYRPRVVVHGPQGMGQAYVGGAILHHLEGYHIQSLELGALIGDNNRTIESAIIQLFVESKRHQPAVIYIPSLLKWCTVIPELARITFKAMLDTLAPTDPILLLAIVDGAYKELPRDVRAWFGHSRENRVELIPPSDGQREDFFAGVLLDVHRPPNQFADGMVRKKRVLELLPIAPPIVPKPLTEAELAAQAAKDHQSLNMLVYKLGPIITEVKRKHKRFCKSMREEYGDYVGVIGTDDVPPPTPEAPPAHVAQPPADVAMVNGDVAVNGAIDVEAEAPPPPPPTLYDMDLERIQRNVYKMKYITPRDFMQDIEKIVYNAEKMFEDQDRLIRAHSMLNAAQVSVDLIDPYLITEFERMAPRERVRREAFKAEKDKGKAKDDQAPSTPPAAIRRSARNNGLEPEIPITDPAKLERRLKRNRSNEEGASDKSGEENNDESRDSKRSRLSAEQDDELNLLQPAPARPGVHFNPIVEAMDVNYHQNPYPEQAIYPHVPMMIDANPISHSPFPASFNNDLPLKEDPDNPFVVGSSSHAQIMPPFAVSHHSNSIASLLNPNDESGPSSAPLMELPSIEEPPPITQEIAVEREPTPTPIPVIERTPTPLPDFHVDENLISQLRSSYRANTSSLTVEQLEQLRATSLACVWRHRAAWDRDNLVRELQDIIGDFVQEVAQDNAESDSDGSDVRM